jgi:hypothetical protein
LVGIVGDSLGMRGLRSWALSADRKKQKLRKVPPVSRGIQRHETVSLQQSVRTDNKVRKQFFRKFTGRSTTAICVPCKPKTGLSPCRFWEVEVDSDSAVREKGKEEFLCGPRVSEQLSIRNGRKEQGPFLFSFTKPPDDCCGRRFIRPQRRKDVTVQCCPHSSP